MGPVFQQPYEPDFGESAGATGAAWPPKCLGIFRRIGHVQGAAIQTHQPPLTIPCSLRLLLCNLGYDRVIESLQRLASQPCARLRNAGIASDLHGGGWPHEPLNALQEAAQYLPIGGAHV